MHVSYLILALILIFYIAGIVKDLREKKRLDVWCLLTFLPFLIFAVTNVALGGSAFNSAETNYELYEAGRYYLHSHGVYTEVSYSCFMFMKVLEVVSISTFAIGFVLAFISRVRSE